MVRNLDIREEQINKDESIFDRFSELSIACYNYPALYLQGLKPAVKDSFNAGEFVEKHPKDGFVEDFCLDDERKEQVKLYRLENVSK